MKLALGIAIALASLVACEGQEVYGRSKTAIKYTGRSMPLTRETNCVLWLTYEYNDGTNFYDYSRNGYDGVITVATNAPIYSTAGEGCVWFDGSGDTIPLPLGVSFAAPCTLSFWVALTNDIGRQLFGVSKQAAATSNRFHIALGEGASSTIVNELVTVALITNMAVGVDAKVLCYSNAAARSWLMNGAWHNLVLVSSGTAWTFYLDGTNQTLVAVQGSNTGFYGPISFVNSAQIGSLAYNGNNFGPFLGTNDEAIIFNRALSAQEVTNLYVREKGWHP